jgi:hypothetical protein
VARVFVVAGFIVLVGLGLRYFLAGDEENTIEWWLHSSAAVNRARSIEQIDEAIGDISGESCASLRGVFEQPTLREPRE